MATTDFDTPASKGFWAAILTALRSCPQLTASRSCPQLTALRSCLQTTLHDPRRLCASCVLLACCAIFGAVQCRAQDVAEAARQEKARKEAQPKKSRHIYTEEDLKRAQILTPEDRTEVEAKKIQPTPPTPQQPQEAAESAVAQQERRSAPAKEMNSQSLPADAPLGDVARHFGKQKESQKLQQSTQFQLPFADVPALASPKPPVQPLLPPVSKTVPPRLAPNEPPVNQSPLHIPKIVSPAPPHLVPFRPLVRRSPFERPRIFRPAPLPVVPSQPPIVRATPSQPAPPFPSLSTTKPALSVVTVKSGDSLWKLAQQNLGEGLRWQDLLAINPNIHDPNHIRAGSQIYLPANVSPMRTATKEAMPPTQSRSMEGMAAKRPIDGMAARRPWFTVQKGDTLSQIAQSQLGHASYATCVARSNPAIRNVNLIYVGQILILPASCTP